MGGCLRWSFDDDGRGSDRRFVDDNGVVGPRGWWVCRCVRSSDGACGGRWAPRDW